MSEGEQGKSAKLLLWYYAFTAVFMLLDYGFDLNVRLTFLDDQPAWRFAWYLFCFASLGLMWWRPDWILPGSGGQLRIIDMGDTPAPYLLVVV